MPKLTVVVGSETRSALSAGLHGEHPLHVPAHRHQIPFPFDAWGRKLGVPADLVAAIFASQGIQMNPIWRFLSSVGLGVAFLYYWPTLLVGSMTN